MKNALSKIVIIIILLAVSYWIVSSIISNRQVQTEKKAVKAEEQAVQAEKLLQIKKSVQEKIVDYNAITDWQDSLDKEGIEPAFTIEVQDALISKESRPLVFLAAVEDISGNGKVYITHFHNWLSLLVSADIHFVLDCTPEQVKEIMKHANHEFENYVVFAQINRVRKIRYGVITDGYEDVRVDSSLPSNIFEASGQCLDLIYVGENVPDDFLENSSQ